MSKTKNFLSLLCIVMILLTNILQIKSVSARENIGSLTITKLETGRRDDDNPRGLPLEGVKFDIYKVDDDRVDITIPEKYTLSDYDSSSDENYFKDTKITGADGKVCFSGLQLGRYLVVEAEAPVNVVEKIANFLVDIPTTNPEGTGLIYDVEVTPKNDTVYGGMVLSKVNENDEPMADVEFILQKKNGEEWETQESEDNSVLATDEEGKITVEGLPAGEYRFIETKTLDGYILDNSVTYNFEVSLGENFATVVIPESIKIVNEKPNISKKIVSVIRDGKNTNSIKDGINSIDIGDIINYEVEIDVPQIINKMTTFNIVDQMNDGLDFMQDTFKVIGINGEEKTELSSGEGNDYQMTFTDHTWNLVFDKEQIKDYKNIEISYSATLNNKGNANNLGNSNIVSLEYSTKVAKDFDNNQNGTDESPIPTKTISDSKKIFTGGFNIEKRALKQNGELLSGAVFKIATSEQNADKGEYITDVNGEEITLTTVDGIAAYKGLSYGTYYLVEVQAPSYQDGEGNTKYYNLLKDPIEINVREDTYEGTANVIVNKKGTILPTTGGIGIIIFITLGIAFIVTGIVYYKKEEK